MLIGFIALIQGDWVKPARAKSALRPKGVAWEFSTKKYFILFFFAQGRKKNTTGGKEYSNNEKSFLKRGE